MSCPVVGLNEQRKHTVNTERLYSASDEAAHQLDRIQIARAKTYAQFTVIANELMLETGASAKDLCCLLDHVHDGLSDMLDNVTTRWTQERDEADVEIGRIEERDLQLSRVS